MYVSKPPTNSISSPDKVKPSVDLTDLSNKNKTTAKSDEDHSACTYYNVLDSVNRNVATLNNESVCISEGSKMPCCDRSGAQTAGVLKKTPDWKGQGWYRYYCLESDISMKGVFKMMFEHFFTSCQFSVIPKKSSTQLHYPAQIVPQSFDKPNKP